MSFRLPISQEGAQFSFSCELEGVSYTFRFRWNDRDGAWFMEIGDGSGNTIISGIKVLLGLYLLNLASSSALPTGDFVAIDTTDQDVDAGFEDLGRRIQIYYFTRDELIANT